METKKILVTGGAGFIGSHLCERLVEEGHEVYCLDDLSSGNKENIKLLLFRQGFRFIEQSIVDKVDVNLRVDEVYHLASMASPKDFKENALHIMLTNSVGTYNALRVALRSNASFLLASTSEIYGDPLRHPQPESYFGNVNPLSVRACYDEGKRFAEAMTMVFFRKYDLDVKIARIFNTYGPKMRVDDGRAIPNFIVQAIEGLPITVYGDGKQTRSFCYVSDMVDGLMKLMGSKHNGEVFNLGNPGEIAIIEVAKMIRELCESKSKIVFSKLPEDDPKRRCPDITKARKKLQWEPKVDLRKGLKLTINYFRDVLKPSI